MHINLKSYYFFKNTTLFFPKNKKRLLSIETENSLYFLKSFELRFVDFLDRKRFFEMGKLMPIFKDILYPEERK